VKALPWSAEQIGELYLSQPRTETGTDDNRYQIDAGTYPIVGKASNDSRRLLLDTAAVYKARREDGETALVPMKMPAVDIVQLQEQGRAKVNDDFKQAVERLAKGIEQGREVSAKLSIGR
jgi:hypothetical protein